MTIPASDAYRIIAQDYDRSPNPLLSLDRRTLPQLLPPVAGQTVVDVAAGTGYWARWCSARGAHAVASDLCADMLVQAGRPAVLADARRLPFRTACADLTICSFGLGYASGCLAELARITRPGGFVVASDLHPAAVERGWKRSFRAGGHTIEVEHAQCSLEELCAPGLRQEMLVEPAWGDPERLIYERAGKAERFETDCGHPAIFAIRWRRE